MKGNCVWPFSMKNMKNIAFPTISKWWDIVTAKFDYSYIGLTWHAYLHIYTAWYYFFKLKLKLSCKCIIYELKITRIRFTSISIEKVANRSTTIQYKECKFIRVKANIKTFKYLFEYTYTGWKIVIPETSQSEVNKNGGFLACVTG